MGLCLSVQPHVFLLPLDGRFQMDRVRIYIDASNLYKGCRAVCGEGRVNLGKFSRFLADGRPLERVKYFCAPPPEPIPSRFNVRTTKGQEEYRAAADSYTRQIGFLQQLQQWRRIQIIWGRLQRTRDDVLKEKGVDVALAVHLVVDSAGVEFETAIVVSGDSDLVLPMTVARDWGKRVEGAAFQPCFHVKQTCASFRFTELTKDIMQPFLVTRRFERPGR